MIRAWAGILSPSPVPRGALPKPPVFFPTSLHVQHVSFSLRAWPAVRQVLTWSASAAAPSGPPWTWRRRWPRRPYSPELPIGIEPAGPDGPCRGSRPGRDWEAPEGMGGRAVDPGPRGNGGPGRPSRRAPAEYGSLAGEPAPGAWADSGGVWMPCGLGPSLAATLTAVCFFGSCQCSCAFVWADLKEDQMKRKPGSGFLAPCGPRRVPRAPGTAPARNIERRAPNFSPGDKF